MNPRKEKPNFRSIAIYTHNKPAKEKEEIEFLNKLLKFFEKHDVKKVSGDVRTVSMLKNKIPLIDDDERFDLKVGIGGDGTILKMMRTLQKKEKEGLLLGINFGTLGFLSELSPGNALKEMEQIFIGENVQEKRDFLKKFIEKIIIRDKEIEIIYYAPGTKFPFSNLQDV